MLSSTERIVAPIEAIDRHLYRRAALKQAQKWETSATGRIESGLARLAVKAAELLYEDSGEHIGMVDPLKALDVQTLPLPQFEPEYTNPEPYAQDLTNLQDNRPWRTIYPLATVRPPDADNNTYA